MGASMPTISFADISAAGGPADQWDALPTAAKLQILGVIGFLEMWSETSSVLKMDGEEHYVRGGKPGYFPKLSRSDDMAFPTLCLSTCGTLSASPARCPLSARRKRCSPRSTTAALR